MVTLRRSSNYVAPDQDVRVLKLGAGAGYGVTVRKDRHTYRRDLFTEQGEESRLPDCHGIHHQAAGGLRHPEPRGINSGECYDV
jgi:hypothetical protein